MIIHIVKIDPQIGLRIAIKYDFQFIFEYISYLSFADLLFIVPPAVLCKK
jgi:hypothetical protein